jgi:hypothetical protein
MTNVWRPFFGPASHGDRLPPERAEATSSGGTGFTLATIAVIIN